MSQFSDAADQILQKSEFSHILGRVHGERIRNVVRVHIFIRHDQRTHALFLHDGEVA